MTVSISRDVLLRLITHPKPEHQPEPASDAVPERAPDEPIVVEFPCVRVYPSLSDDTALLVGFDSNERPRIKVELLKADVTEEWKPWILRYVRRREEREIHLMK